MQITKVRSRFHTLIDEVENPDLLLFFFELFKWRAGEPEAGLWKSLSITEKEAVISAFEESEKAGNLVANTTVKKKYRQWLKP